MAQAVESSGTNRAVRDAVSWLGDAVKVAGPAILALCVMWVRVDSHSEDLSALKRETEVRAARVQAIEASLIGLQATQTADQREVLTGMRRLEEVVREVRADVKELQRRP